MGTYVFLRHGDCSDDGWMEEEVENRSVARRRSRSLLVFCGRCAASAGQSDDHLD
jgi:hypothetical protein